MAQLLTPQLYIYIYIYGVSAQGSKIKTWPIHEPVLEIGSFFGFGVLSMKKQKRTHKKKTIFVKITDYCEFLYPNGKNTPYSESTPCSRTGLRIQKSTSFSRIGLRIRHVLAWFTWAGVLYKSDDREAVDLELFLRNVRKLLRFGLCNVKVLAMSHFEHIP